jgi:hypothetical protein
MEVFVTIRTQGSDEVVRSRLSDLRSANEWASGEWEQLTSDLLEHGTVTIGGGAAPISTIKLDLDCGYCTVAGGAGAWACPHHGEDS